MSVFAKCGHSVQNMAAVCGRCIPANADELLASLRATIEEQRQRIVGLEGDLAYMGAEQSAANKARERAEQEKSQAESERDRYRSLWEKETERAFRAEAEAWDLARRTTQAESERDAAIRAGGNLLRLAEEIHDSALGQEWGWIREATEPELLASYRRALARNPEGPPRRSTRDGEG